MMMVGGFLLLSFGFFINQKWLSLGWVLGSVISLINYLLLEWFASLILQKQIKNKGLIFLSYFLKQLMYILGLFICIILQKYHIYLFFWGSCLASYLVSIIIIVIMEKKI
jgi:hypothetical protein